MRRQQGVVESPICLPISATGIVQSFCRMSRIFLSIRSSMAVLTIFLRDSSMRGISFLFHTNPTKLVEYYFSPCKSFFQNAPLDEFAHLPTQHRQELVLEPSVAREPRIVAPGGMRQRQDAAPRLAPQMLAPIEHGRLEAFCRLGTEMKALRIGTDREDQLELR